MAPATCAVGDALRKMASALPTASRYPCARFTFPS